MLVICHRRFLPSMEGTVFCLPAFFYLIIKAFFWAMYFPLFSVFNRLFGNMTRRCLAQISGPQQQRFYLPPSFLPSLLPQSSPVQNSREFSVTNYNLFIVCGTGIFQLSYCSLPKIFFFGYTRLAEERVTYSVKFKNPGKNFCGLFIIRPPYKIDFSLIL